MPESQLYLDGFREIPTKEVMQEIIKRLLDMNISVNSDILAEVCFNSMCGED